MNRGYPEPIDGNGVRVRIPLRLVAEPAEPIGPRVLVLRYSAPAAIDSFTAAPDRFVDGDDDVIVFGRYGGTMKHSGAKLDAPFCHVYCFKGDRIVSFQQYTD